MNENNFAAVLYDDDEGEKKESPLVIEWVSITDTTRDESTPKADGIINKQALLYDESKYNDYIGKSPDYKPILNDIVKDYKETNNLSIEFIEHSNQNNVATKINISGNSIYCNFKNKDEALEWQRGLYDRLRNENLASNLQEKYKSIDIDTNIANQYSQTLINEEKEYQEYLRNLNTPSVSNIAADQLSILKGDTTTFMPNSGFQEDIYRSNVQSPTYVLAEPSRQVLRQLGKFSLENIYCADTAGDGFKKLMRTAEYIAEPTVYVMKKRMQTAYGNAIGTYSHKDVRHMMGALITDMENYGINASTLKGKSYSTIITANEYMAKIRMANKRGKIDDKTRDYLLERLKQIKQVGRYNTFNTPKHYMLNQCTQFSRRMLQGATSNTDTGKGLFIALDVGKRSSVILKTGMKTVSNLVNASLIAGKQGILFIIRRKRDNLRNGLNNLKGEEKRLASARLKKLNDRLNAKKTRKTPLKNVKSRALKKIAGEKAANEITKRGLKGAFRHTVKKALTRKMQKYAVGRAVATIVKALADMAKAAAAAATFATTIFAIVLAVIAVITGLCVLGLIINSCSAGTIQAAQYDARSNERVYNELVEYIEELHAQSLESLNELNDDADSSTITVSYHNYITPDTYNTKAQGNYVEEDLNVAEMISMLYVLNGCEWNYSYISIYKKQLEELYHCSNIVTVSSTSNEDSDGNTEYIASVDITSYYFDDIFENMSGGYSWMINIDLDSATGYQYVVGYLVLKMGYSLEAACGIAGNVSQESGFNPMYDNRSTGVGLFQMTDGRADKLKNYIKENNNGVVDLSRVDLQLEYACGDDDLGQQLSSYTGKLTQPYNISKYGYSKAYVGWPTAVTLEDFKKFSSPEDATVCFCQCVERASEPHLYSNNCEKGKSHSFTGRVAKAQEFYDSLKSADITSYFNGTGIYNIMMSYLGGPYVYGAGHGSSATEPGGKLDCSSYVSSVYMKMGLLNSIGSSVTLRSVGTSVSTTDESQWRTGDIICYDGHVALYIGKDTVPSETYVKDIWGNKVKIGPGYIIHASNSAAYSVDSKGVCHGGGVKVSPSAKYRKILAVRRLTSSIN